MTKYRAKVMRYVTKNQISGPLISRIREILRSLYLGPYQKIEEKNKNRKTGN
jgi:hypothetical protein